MAAADPATDTAGARVVRTIICLPEPERSARAATINMLLAAVVAGVLSAAALAMKDEQVQGQHYAQSRDDRYCRDDFAGGGDGGNFGGGSVTMEVHGGHLPWTSQKT